jgi:glycosyltransferase involved in cell wall biosynthesis
VGFRNKDNFNNLPTRFIITKPESLKVALLTNFIPPYRLSLFRKLNSITGDLCVFVSTEMEKNRDWVVNHEALNVVVQKSWSYNKTWKNKQGFTEQTEVHIPYDTLSQLRKQNADVVISAEMGFRSLFAAIYCKLHKKPLILWLTLSEFTEKNKKGLRILLRKVLLKNATVVFCNGASGERYINTLGYKGKVFFAPYTSDYKLIKKESFRPSKSLLFVGQLTERKGIAEMVAALEIVLNENSGLPFELIVAGDGPQKKVFNTLMSYHQFTLTMLGSVKYDVLSEVYKTANFLLFPTLADEWGVVVNEALASGVPVIGSKYSQAVEELIVEEQNGWIVDPHNSKEFAQKIKQALTTKESKFFNMSAAANNSIQQIMPSTVANSIQQAILFATS